MSTILLPLELFGRVRREINLRAVNELGVHQLGPKQAVILRYLQGNPKSSNAQLGRATGTDPAAVGRTVDTLIKQGFVRRTEHPTDRRQWVLELTGNGAKKMKEVNKVFEHLSQNMVASLSKTEKAEFEKLLAKILKGLERTRSEEEES